MSAPTSEHARRVLTVRAHAKVNLFLEVLGKRDDGYHELVTAMQAIGVADTLTFVSRDDGDIDLRLVRAAPQLAGDQNLVVRAAHALRATTGCTRGATITLDKQIPMTAGLGGGSADAAATLLGLNRLWGLRIEQRALQDIAVAIGSDVPFFVQPAGLALCTGRGEHVLPQPRPDPRPMLLVALELAVSTPRVFRALEPPDILVRRPGNALQAPAERLFPEIARARGELNALTGQSLTMSGSGPSLFCWAETTQQAHQWCQLVAAQGYRAWATRTVSRPTALQWERPARV